MTSELISIITLGIGLASLMIGLVVWLRADIRDQGRRMDDIARDQRQRLDKLDARIGTLEQTVAALKATVETFFRVRIDQPDPDHHDQAA